VRRRLDEGQGLQLSFPIGGWFVSAGKIEIEWAAE
jgi:hypothetical protein